MICLSAATSQLMVACSDHSQSTPAESLAKAKQYEIGDGIPIDMVEAIRQYEIAAKGGSLEAALELVNIFDNGKKGATRDSMAIAKWLKVAAELGDSASALRLALMTDKGEGVTMDPVEAARWYLLSANAGNSDAALEIGIRLADGIGVAQDPIPMELASHKIQLRQSLGLKLLQSRITPKREDGWDSSIRLKTAL